MSRIRLNQEYRNKIGTRMRVHIEAEDTQEKKTYDDLKADQIEINDNAWTLAKQIVRRHYTEDDVAKAYYLQNKFENVDNVQHNQKLSHKSNSNMRIMEYLEYSPLDLIYPT